MSDDLEITFEVAIAAGLDAVWALLTTAEGRRSWLAPEAEIELRPGGRSTVGWGGEDRIDGVVESVEPGQRLRITYVHEGEPIGVEEWLVSHDAGVTHVRLFQSLPDDGSGWDGWYGDLARGWRLFLASLAHAAAGAVSPSRVVLPRFVPAPEGRQATWARVLATLGIDEPAAGDVVGVEGWGSAHVALAEAPHGLLLTTSDRTLLCDLEGSDDGLVLYLQAATHGRDSAQAKGWRTSISEHLSAANG